jgi:ABC-type uncharacterized transport system auxiliary subunit
MSIPMPRTALASLLALVFVLLAACGAAKPIHYYALEPPSVAPSAGNPHAVTLMLGRFSAPNVYRDTRLLYRTGLNEMNIYEQQRWVEPPAEMVKGMFLRVLRQSGRYRSVHLMGSNVRGDYVLRGRVHRFEEVDAPGLGARVAIEADLYDPATGTTLWTHHYQQEETANGNTVPAVVEALNRNVQRGVSEIVASLDQYFTDHPPAPPAAAKTSP